MSPAPATDRRVSRGPRIRTLKPDCWQDEALGECSRDARLLWVGLITQADDEGYQRGSMALLRSLIFPYDHGLPLDDIACWLAELIAARLAVHYQIDGRYYIYLTGFTANQKIDKPSASRWPHAPNSPNDPRTICERSRTVAPEGKGVDTEGSGEQPRERVSDSAAAALHPAFADVMAIAQEAYGKDSTLQPPQDFAIERTLRAYPEADHLRAANLAASDLLSGRRTTRHFEKVLADQLADQAKPAAVDRRSERDQRGAEDLAALRSLRGDARVD